MIRLHDRIDRLERQAGVDGIDPDKLALLAPDERDGYLALRKRELRTLTDAELDRLIAAQVKMMGGIREDKQGFRW